MVTRGIIEQMITPYLFKVRLPLLNSMNLSSQNTLVEDLNTAVACTVPHVNYGLHVGDVVFVAFEENEFGKPVIIGCLFRENMGANYLDVDASTIKASVNASLPVDTVIGEIDYSNLKCLKGSKENIQNQIDLLLQRIINLEEKVKDLHNSNERVD